MTYLFASSNKGKAVEVRETAQRFGIAVASPAELQGLPPPPEVEESAATYRGNALLKAKAYCDWSGLPSFGDDSGLEVEALNGAPGIYSARYAGEPSNPQRNIEKLLGVLSCAGNRRAAFRSVICLVRPGAEPLYVEAVLHGEIGREQKGAGGFGYDPVFVVDGFGATLAELKERGIEVKTHRILALEKLFSELR